MKSKLLRPDIKAIAFSALTLLILFWSYSDIYRNYFPFGDDPAVFLASAGNPARWFTEGFSKYFIVYPEWSIPFTDFLRPGVNLLIRTDQVLFRQHYIFYFVMFYAAQLLLCVLVVKVCNRLGLSGSLSALLGVLTAINPAFINLDLVSATNHFDVWCGIFAFLAFYLIMYRWYGLAIVSLILAIFTKEAALYSPIAACMVVYFETRRKWLSVSMLLPLALWAAVRQYIFVGNINGLYVLSLKSYKPFLLGVAKGLLQWPLGVVDPLALKQILVHHSIFGHIPDVMLMMTNIVLWVFFIAIVIYLAKDLFSGCLTKTQHQLALPILVWLTGALSFGVLVGQDPRFGGSIYPLELIFCASLFANNKNRLIKPAALIALIFITAAFAWNLRTVLFLRQLAEFEPMKNLAATIARHADDASTIYILNSPGSFSNPSSIGELDNISSRLIILSEFHGCLKGSVGPAQIHVAEHAMRVTSILPDCAAYVFDSASPLVLARAFDGTLQRGNYASYYFPEGRIAERSLRDQSVMTLHFGKELDVVLKPSTESYILLYYDWRTSKYLCAGPQCRGDSL